MSKQTILIIDDDETIQQLIQQNLTNNGYKHLSANNGEEGISALSKNTNIDGIILDIMMPIMDGAETLKHIKQNEQTKDIPVLILTGQNAISDVSKYLSMGANDYMVKPFDHETLIARLQQIMPMTLEFSDE